MLLRNVNNFFFSEIKSCLNTEFLFTKNLQISDLFWPTLADLKLKLEIISILFFTLVKT